MNHLVELLADAGPSEVKDTQNDHKLLLLLLESDAHQDVSGIRTSTSRKAQLGCVRICMRQARTTAQL